MTPLLEHELVRKYFGGNYVGPQTPEHRDEVMAYRILQAMTSEIKQGDLVLERFPSKPDNEWQLTKSPAHFDADMHAGWLLLPNQFQPRQGCKHECVKCEDHRCDLCDPKPDTERRECVCESSPQHCKCACHGNISHVLTKPNPVEEKIKEILRPIFIQKDILEKEIRELVELTRRSGPLA